MPQVAGREIGPIGYGMMGLSLPPVPKPVDVALVAMKKSLLMGANFWNAGEFYGTPQHNSLHLLQAYFDKYPEDAEKVVLSVKVGFDFATMAPDNSAANLRKSAEYCANMLKGRKKVNILEAGRVDPKVSIEDTVKTLVQLRNEGLFGSIGLSEVSAETVKRAAKVGEIAAVEIELSLWSTDPLQNGLFDTCADLKIPVVGYSPLGSGFLTGTIKSLDDLAEHDYRRFSPRFQPDAFPKNLELVEAVNKVAAKKGCKPSQIAISWLLSLQRDGLTIIPLPGASNEARVEENLTVVKLTNEELSEISKLLASFKVSGARYGGPLAAFMEG